MKSTIRICNIDLSFHAASAAVVKQLAANHGVQVEASAASHEEANDWKNLHVGNGEVSALDHQITVERMAAAKAADTWLQERAHG